MLIMKFILWICAGILTSVAACAAGEVKVPISYVTNTGPGGKNQLVRTFVRVPVVVSKGVVQVRVGDIPNDFPLIPAQAMSLALKANPKAKQFKLIWESSGLHYSLKSALIYDRSRKTAKFFNSGSGGEGEFYNEYGSYNSLSNVTDQAFHKWAGADKGATRESGPRGPVSTQAQSSDYFLARYGARLVDSKKWEHKPKP
jgi:hypothetical protein